MEVAARQAAPARERVRRPGARARRARARAREYAAFADRLCVSVGRGEGRRMVLRDASLSVPAGELHMLIGANGAGKSTLLRALAGLLRADGPAGSLHVAGPRSVVMQNPDHQVVLPSVRADVAFGLGSPARTVSTERRPTQDSSAASEEASGTLLPRDVRLRVDAALSAVGMVGLAERPVASLSGGQKQRVAIAGALAERSALLLLDELTTFLDAEDQWTVLRAVRGLVGLPSGGDVPISAIWVTHRLDEVAEADGLICVTARGKLEQRSLAGVPREDRRNVAWEMLQAAEERG